MRTRAMRFSGCRCAGPVRGGDLRRGLGPAEPRDRLHRIMELEVGNAAAAVSCSTRRGEARIGPAVVLDEVVLHADLVDKVAAEVRFADPVARAVIGIGDLRHR